MSKIALQNLDNLQNEASTVAAFNNNNALIREAVDNTLSRDGTAPNQMNAPLDMNSEKIINLIDATTDQEPVTYGQFTDTIGALQAGGVVTGSYVTLTPNSTLTQERILTPGTNISITDSGPGDPITPGTVTVAVNDADLNAVAALSTTGLISRTGAGTASTRTVTGTANEITVTNGDGVAGDPTTSLPSSLTFTGKTVTGGTYVNPRADAILTADGGSVQLVGTPSLSNAAGIKARDLVISNSYANTPPALGIWTQGGVQFAGSSSGSTQVNASAAASGTLTLPAATDTLVGKATTDTLTNKTYDTAGAGNSFLINGLAATANTGTGSVVRATSPALVTPALGTPASGTLTNCTGLPLSGHTNQAAYTIVANNTGSSAAPTAMDVPTITSKASPVAADIILIQDSAASNAFKRTTVGAVGSAGAVSSVNNQTGSLTLPVLPQGRLTLQTLTPVMTSTQSAKTTIYYTAYHGNQVPIYDGTNMVSTPITGGEISVATTDTTKSPAAIGASKVNDWFIWNDAGTIRIGHGPDWTSDTVRSAGTALTMVNGILLNNASLTNGPAASRGTYVGTTRSNGSSQLDWIIGGSASGGTAGFLGVWNAYNRVSAQAAVIDSGAAYTYTSATIRQARASAGNQISFISGLAEDGLVATYSARCTILNTVNSNINFGIGLDSTTTFSFQPVVNLNETTGANLQFSSSNTVNIAPQLGVHIISSNESSDGTNVNTFDVASTNNLSIIIRN